MNTYQSFAVAPTWQERYLDRIIEEMSPAYLVLVAVMAVCLKLVYKYLVKKIDLAIESERQRIKLTQESVKTIKTLAQMFDELHERLENIGQDHGEIRELLESLHENYQSLERKMETAESGRPGSRRIK